MTRNSLNVLTWNIDRNETDISLRYDNILLEISKTNADIVCLQENFKSEKLSVAKSLIENHDYNLINSNEKDMFVLAKNCTEVEPLVDSITEDYLAAGFFKIKNQKLLVGSAHLSWGTGKENVRLSEVLSIENLFKAHTDLDPFRGENNIIGILCGDLNTEPESSSIRFLKGLGVENHMSTMWTDSWVVGNGEGITSSSSNLLAGRTAKSVGLGTGNLPNRRIDYILVRGYAYSRPGEFESSVLVGVTENKDLACSDHYGILTKILL